MSVLCDTLHALIRKGKHFDFSMGYNEIPLNGIYIIFEKGEEAHGGNRIVRIGTHTGKDQLKSRIYQHFENKNKNRSIFRKNIGRCLLNKTNHPYLSTWNLDLTTKEKKEKYKSLIDIEFEKEMENKVSEYIQNNFSFSVLTVPTKEDRLYYESKLIGTVSACNDCISSDTWLGCYSPIEKIRKSGLWQVMELYSVPLNEEELSNVSKLLLCQEDGGYNGF